MMLIIRTINISVIVIVILATGLSLYINFYIPPLSDNYGKVDAQLYLGDAEIQPLIVAFGGSQGGNTWTEEYWADMRNKFLKEGFAVLSIGYFNTENTPQTLDRISLNAIYDTIKSMSNHPKINSNEIALLGSSKGGELVLNLASRYRDFEAVIAMVPSHVTFSGNASTITTSSWTYNDKEIDFIKIPFYKYIWSSIHGDPESKRKVVEESEKSSYNSVIEVENINGPILLMSAKNDKLWPSGYMSKKVINRLSENQFGYHYEHFSFYGSHYDTKKHFEVVFKFLDQHFKPK